MTPSLNSINIAYFTLLFFTNFLTRFQLISARVIASPNIFYNFSIFVSDSPNIFAALINCATCASRSDFCSNTLTKKELGKVSKTKANKIKKRLWDELGDLI